MQLTGLVRARARSGRTRALREAEHIEALHRHTAVHLPGVRLAARPAARQQAHPPQVPRPRRRASPSSSLAAAPFQLQRRNAISKEYVMANVAVAPVC